MTARLCNLGKLWKITSQEPFKNSVNVTCLRRVPVWFSLRWRRLGGDHSGSGCNTRHVPYIRGGSHLWIPAWERPRDPVSSSFLITFMRLLSSHEACPSCFCRVFFWSGFDTVIMRKEYLVLWNKGLPMVSVILCATNICWVSPVELPIRRWVWDWQCKEK